MVCSIAFKTFFSSIPKEEKEEKVKITTNLKNKKHRSRFSEIRQRLADKRNKRKQNQPSAKGLVEVDAISDQIKGVEQPQEKITLINQLWNVDDPALPKLVNELLNEDNSDVRMAAIELLENKEKGEILESVEKALDDPNQEIREFAVFILSETQPSEKSKVLLAKSVDDSSEDVRAAAFDVISDQDVKTQEQIFSQSIYSPYLDAKEMTVDLILDIPSHRTVNLLFQGLNDSDPDFREYVTSKLDFLFGKEFKNYNEAVAWWNKNKDKYDEELFEK